MWLLSALVQKNLSESKLKSFRWTALAEDMSGQSSVDCVAWLLVATLKQTYNKRGKLTKETYKIYILKRKEALGIAIKLGPGLKKEMFKPEAKWNQKESDGLRETSHPAKLPTSKRKA